MPKRKRSSTFTTYDRKRRFIKKARTRPARAYPNSMVPLASRGYNFGSPEMKCKDLASNSYVGLDDNTASLVSCVAGIVQGTGIGNRIGTRILVKSIHIIGEFACTDALATPPADSNSGAHVVKISIILDMQPNGALPGITDIFDGVSPIAHLNIQNRDRFKVIKQKVWTLDPYLVSRTVAGEEYACAVNQIRYIKIFKKCSLPVFYNNGNAGTSSDLSSNNIVIVMQSNAPNNGSGDTCRMTCRVRYIDN